MGESPEIELLRRAWDALIAGGPEVLGEVLAPDAQWYGVEDGQLCDASAMIHELVVDGIEVWTFPRAVRPSARPVSWRYEIDLGVGGDQVHRISQEVRGGEGDRFEIRLGTSEPIFPFVGGFLYLFRAVLRVDATRTELVLGRFLVRVPQPMRVLGYHGAGRSQEELQDHREKAKRLVERVSRGILVQDRAQVILDEVLLGKALPDPAAKRGD